MDLMDLEGASAMQDDAMDALMGDIDFTSEEGSCSPASSGQSTCDVIDESEGARNGSSLKKLRCLPIPKVDYAVDHLSPAMLHALLQPTMVETKNYVQSKFVTAFKKKYFRFDNKALQCFPGCARFADVREARMQGLDHKGGARAEAFCTNAVVASLVVPSNVPLTALHVVGRFLCATPETAVLPDSDAPLLDVGAVVSYLPSANCVQGTVQVSAQGEVTAAVHPSEAWFFNMTLPRHRRNAACAAHKVPLFVFELLSLVQHDTSRYQVVSRAVSAPFEVASIRTLIREVLSFRQQNLLANLQTRREEQAIASKEETDNTPRPAPIMAAPIAPAPAVIAEQSPAMAATMTPMQMAAGYSHTVHRIRLAEATRREEEHKKNRLIPNYRVSPAPEVATSFASVPAMDLSFDLPDVFGEMPDFDEIVFTGPNMTAVRAVEMPPQPIFDFFDDFDSAPC